MVKKESFPKIIQPDNIKEILGVSSNPIYYENNDLDIDGVINSIDLCPSTPLGFEVDETGCSLRIDPSQLVDGKFPISCFPFISEVGQYFHVDPKEGNDVRDAFKALRVGYQLRGGSSLLIPLFIFLPVKRHLSHKK